MRISRRSAMVSGRARMRRRGMVVVDLQQEDGSAEHRGPVTDLQGEHSPSVPDLQDRKRKVGGVAGG